jgi:hypothetical protein
MENKWLIRGLFMAIVIMSQQCRPQGNSDSKQVFTDAQRQSINHEEAPYILRLANQCTAYIIDKTLFIAITADHCGPELNMPVCFGANTISDQSCSYAATITELLEDKTKVPQADVEELDYTVFKFQFSGAIPANMKALKLSGSEAILTKAVNEKMPLALVGYPGDNFQNGALTRSDCVARAGMQLEVDPENDKLIKAWEADAKYKGDPEYAQMRQACAHVNNEPKRFRPSFIADCSVYGGNSGGPLKFADHDIALGMPATYLPSPQTPVPEGDCLEKYWDKFFKPLTNSVTKEQVIAEGKKQRENWDKLDRSTTDMNVIKATFPREIPLHLIVEKSPFFLSNPQYVVKDIPGSGGNNIAAAFNMLLANGVTNGQADMWVSTNLQIAKLSLCYGNAGDCKKSAKEDVAFIAGKSPQSTATFFMATKGFSFDKEQPLTLLGFDAQGKVAYAAEKAISPR